MSHVSVTTLWQRLSQGQIETLYVFCGAEAYLVQQYISTLIERLVTPAQRDFNCDTFSAAEAALIEAVSVARTLPMMASHRVVVLHDIDQLRKAEWSLLEAYLAAPSPSTVFICSSHDSELKQLATPVWQQALTVVCAPLTGSRLHAWVTQTVSQAGYRISTEAVQVLLQAQEPDLQILLQEIHKLCTYIGPAGEIQVHDVQAVVQASRLHSVFALSDALGNQRLATALVEMDHLLNQGEPPLVILSMIIRHLRLLWSVKHLLQQSQDAGRIAKAVRVPPSVCRQLMGQSRSLSTARLQQLYIAALEADIAFKSSNKPPKAILEGLVLNLCAGS